MHTYTHTYIHTYIHTYTHTYIHTHMHTYIHIYIQDEVPTGEELDTDPTLIPEEEFEDMEEDRLYGLELGDEKVCMYVCMYVCVCVRIHVFLYASLKKNLKIWKRIGYMGLN